MTRTRIQKQRKTRRRTSEGTVEALRTTAGCASQLLKSVDDLLEEIDRTLRSAG